MISRRLVLACIAVLALLIAGALNGGFGFLTTAWDFLVFLLTGVKP